MEIVKANIWLAERTDAGVHLNAGEMSSLVLWMLIAMREAALLLLSVSAIVLLCLSARLSLLSQDIFNSWCGINTPDRGLAQLMRYKSELFSVNVPEEVLRYFFYSRLMSATCCIVSAPVIFSFLPQKFGYAFVLITAASLIDLTFLTYRLRTARNQWVKKEGV